MPLCGITETLSDVESVGVVHKYIRAYQQLPQTRGNVMMFVFVAGFFFL
jgi:hypothetical protein